MTGEPPHLRLAGEHAPPPHLKLSGGPPPYRRRRYLATAGSVAVLTLAAVVIIVLAGSRRPAVAVSVGATAYGPVHPAGFVGLSIEFPALAAYLGANPRRIDPVFTGLVRALAPGGAPVLRIGGDSTDHTWWPTPGVKPRPGVDYALTPAWMASARALTAQTGAKLILGINLADGSTRLAAAEARAMIARIGRGSISALEIGNEPDLYSSASWYRRPDHGAVGYARPRSWSEDAYYREFKAFARALPSLPLAGPAYAHPQWIRQLPQFLAAESRVGLVTYHRYPLQGCSKPGRNQPRPTVPNLLSDRASAGLASQIAPYVAVAHRAGLPFRLDELNSVSCRGEPGVSDTFASSMWILDTLFNLAAAGVDGVNVHTLPQAPYEPFTFSRSGGSWTASVRPVYYGMLMFARAFPAGARLLRVHVPAGPLKVWATRAPDRRLHVVVINQSPRVERVELKLPASVRGPLSAQWLAAPSLRSTRGVVLGGRSFGATTMTGRLGPPERKPISPTRPGSYPVTLPGAGAVLLTG